MTGPRPPSVPDDRLSGWSPVERGEETLLEVGPVAVRAATVVYEDAALRAAVSDGDGVDATVRFFLAARLSIPGTSPSQPLEALVFSRARRTFADRLRDRGFEDVSPGPRRDRDVGGDRARVVGYDAACRIDDLRLAVDGWLAARATDGGYLLTGGAYPTAVVEGAAPTLAAHLDPESFRAELFALIDATT